MTTLILLASSPRIALPVLQAARSAGLGRCFLAGTPETRGLRWSALCDGYLPIRLDDDSRTAAALDAIADRMPGAILVPCDCDSVRVVHRLQHRLRLATVPIPAAATLDMFDDKWRFHGFCRAHALPVPPTVFVGPKSRLDFDHLAQQLGLPFMVKPADRSGSLGVVTVGSRADLRRQVQGRADYPDGALIAQRYVDGWDIDISLLAVHGQVRALACHRVDGCWIEFVPVADLEAIAEAMCGRSGYHGVMNVDARIDRATGQVLLIECNPRFWATLAAPTGCGLNFLAESVRASAQLAGAPRRLAAGRFNQRHPLLQPAVWWALLADPQERGRLLRASAFDPYTLGRLAVELPAMGGRSLRRAGRFVGARALSQPAA